MTEGVDTYSWLEADGSPKVQAWDEAQRNKTRAALDQLPTRPYIHRQLIRWSEQPQETYRQVSIERSNVFTLVTHSSSGPAQLVVFPVSELRSNRLENAFVLLDPLKLDPSGLTSIRWFVISPEAQTVAVLLHQADALVDSLRLYDISTGSARPDVLPNAQTSTRQGSAAWSRDGLTLLYTRYPTPTAGGPGTSAGLVEIFSHRLGTEPGIDTREAVRDVPMEGEAKLQASWDARRFTLSVRHPSSRQFAHWVRDLSGTWKQVAKLSDEVDTVRLGRAPAYIEMPQDDGLYLLSHNNHPKGQILRAALEASHPLAQAQVIIPESKEVIIDFEPSASGVYVSTLKGGMGNLLFYDLAEKDPIKAAVVLPVDDPGTVNELFVSHGDQMLYRTQTYTIPSAWLVYDPNVERDKAHSTVMSDLSPVDFQDTLVERLGVTSADGTRVPLFVIRRKGTRLDGTLPFILSAYGAEGLNQMPEFEIHRKLWLNQVGAYAVAQLRGGGELGSDWRKDGLGERKQHSIDDLIACAEFLVRSNYTRPHLLSLAGTGYGATLAAAAMVQKPQWFQAAVLTDGAYDLMRAEAYAHPESFTYEWGSILDRNQLAGLTKLSPYPQLRGSNLYPALLFASTSELGSFSAMHSRKMVATMQSNLPGRRPAWWRPADPASPQLSQRWSHYLLELTDAYAFVFDQLSQGYSLVERGPWSGGITASSAMIKAKLSESGMVARLVVSSDPVLKDPQYSAPVRSDAMQHDLVEFQSEGLIPNTDYHYALEVNGRLDWQTRGQFRTFPAGPASFRMAFASCAKTGSSNEVFDRIREQHPLFFLHMGDFHYQNISANSVKRFWESYDTVLGSLAQSRLYQNVPVVYMWDDHDSGGNNSDKKSSSHPAARKAYADFVPHYPLLPGTSDPIYHAFSVGRVRFIITDLRSDRDDVAKKDDAQKSLLGANQKEWFKKELLEANGKYPLICWMSTVPWLGVAGSNYYGFIKHDQYGRFYHNDPAASKVDRSKLITGEDHWAMYSTERREIADFIKNNRIHEVCILHGDSHMLAADDGSHSDFATGGGAPMRIMCAAPLDQTPSLKGGPYSEGVYKVKAGEGCFGLLDIQDQGRFISVQFSGRNHRNEEKMSLKFQVPVGVNVPVSPPQRSP